jgi:hypothetical protein
LNETKTISVWGNNIFNRIAIFALIALVCFLLFRSCDKSNEIQRFKTNNAILKEDVKYTKSKLGQEIASKSALEVSLKELKKGYWIKDDSLKDITRGFKKIQSATIIKTKYKVDTVTIVYDSPGKEYFKREWSKITPHFTISGVSTNAYTRIDSLTLLNTQRLVIGTKKGFFNNQLTASITNSNPYIITTDILTQSVSIPNKRFGVGFFAGVDVLGKPTVGVGVTYSLIRF